MSADLVDRMNLLAARLNYNGFPESATDADEAATQLAKDAAEIVRLRAEVEALRQCGVKYLGWLGVKDAENGLRKDMADPEMVDRPAPAMPNGVQGVLSQARAVLERFRAQDDDAATVINRIDALRAADHRDAAGVLREAFANGDAPTAGYEKHWDDTPAAVPAGEAAAQTLRDALAYVGYRTDGDLSTLAERAELWMRESRVLIDSQSELIAWMKADATTPQPADGEASMFSGQSDAQIAHAVRMAEQHYRSLGRDPVYCNVSLSVLRDCTPPAPVQAAPQEWCPFCGGTGGHWEGCRAPVDTSTHPAAGDKVRELADALRLARNRIQRLVLECPHGSSIRDDAMEWAGEASDALESTIAQPQEADRG